MMTNHDRLRTEFGKAPSSVDVRWAMLNEDLQTPSAHRDIGSYRNIPCRSVDVTVGGIQDRPQMRHLLPVVAAGGLVILAGEDVDHVVED